MRTIALEEHMLPKDVMRDVGIDPVSVLGMVDALDDVGEGRLAVMDSAGIDIQVLSVQNSRIQQLGPERAGTISRDLNDRMAAIVRAHPGRFRAFASLPMCDPLAAAEELTRAVGELGFVGTLVAGQTNGVFLDHPSMRPVLATAERLGVPIYLHPAPPPPAVFDAYFSGLERKVAAMLSTSAWGWHAETGMHVLRVVVSGTFERFPGLQLIVGHMGENLPFSLARADERLTPVSGLATSVSDTIREHVWITTSAYTTEAPLLCALRVIGADRMMFAVDYPFSDSAQSTAFLRDAPLTTAERAKIAHENAERLLRI
ncbi:MAG TPA: amidohydrolase family protein [Candidatus Acidoferrum sp.]|nr:amidohydrolase family protein [Candidatus Acidoferrum sp.]